MADNRTTELLCKLLEERGIKWKDGDAAYEIEWSTPDGRHCSAMYWKPTFTVFISGCTPEQAIAATLDDGEYEVKMDALLSRLTNGKFSKSRAYDLDFMESCVNEEFEELYAKELADATLGNGALTAEQVREAIESRFDFDVWVPPARWQAIADELNAELRAKVVDE